jgi:predicted metal-dependent hydrolase
MQVEYVVKRSWRKSTALKIKDGKLYVYASYLTTDAQIEKLILSHQRWITNNLTRQRINLNYDLEKDDMIWILGKGYRLTVHTGCRKNLVINDDELILEGRSLTSVSADLRDYLCQIVDREVRQIKAQLGLDFTVSYRRYKSRWGCCYHSRNTIVLNYLLGCTPLGCIREVIYHEICHFREHNHQKGFYDQLQRLCPDYRKWVRELKKYSIE